MNGNFFDLLRAHWAVAPHRDFLVPSSGAPITYSGMDDRSARIASVLRTRGVHPGDRVVVQIDKSIDGVALYLACLRIGAVYVPLNTAYTSVEVDYFIDDAAPTVTIRRDDVDELSAAADTANPWVGVESRLADDLAAMVYTSGTTGRSKGAMLTHANLASNALTLHAIWRFTPGDVLLHVLPIYHVHGLFVALHTAMLNASTVLFPTTFDIDETLDLLDEATVMMGVPTHYIRLLADPRFDSVACANMRLFTSGSAPMTTAVHETFTARTGHTILERYGMSECGMITSNPYDGDRVPGTVGYPLPGVRIRVVEDRNECSPGDIGIVQVVGPNVFAGYWRQDDKTEQAHQDEWFITGDVGWVDDHGRLTLEGRSSDMIISGGLNIYPKEIEMVLDDCDGVLESAVVGLPDPDFGERVAAFVVADATATIDTEKIATELRSQLASFKVPRSIEVVEELPRNSMGKIQKAALRNTA